MAPIVIEAERCARNLLSRILPSIDAVSETQIGEMIDAFDANGELQGSSGFSGTKPTIWGGSLVPHLHRWGSRRYIITTTWPRRIAPDF